MAKEPTLYVCKNPACELGTEGQLGRFTSGLTAQAYHLKTGEPLDTLEKGVHYGEGFCPNPSCRQKGERWDPEKAKKAALGEVKERHKLELAAIEEGVN